MSTCSHCGHKNITGALVCAECEEPLDDVVLTTTTRQLEKVEDLAGRPQWGSARFGADSVLVLHIRDASEPLTVQIGDEAIMGRADPDTDTAPHIALDDYQAAEKGVSRQHASIRRQDDALHIIDLQSANATFLNGMRLLPHQPRVLRDGDELRLGRLVMRVYFKHAQSATSHE